MVSENRARIDVLGLDYYSHSELAWTKNGRATVHPVAGFAAVALDYAGGIAALSCCRKPTCAELSMTG
jgi:hypothetical protein